MAVNPYPTLKPVAPPKPIGAAAPKLTSAAPKPVQPLAKGETMQQPEPMFKNDPHAPGPGGNGPHPILEMLAAAKQGAPGGPPSGAPPPGAPPMGPGGPPPGHPAGGPPPHGAPLGGPPMGGPGAPPPGHPAAGGPMGGPPPGAPPMGPGGPPPGGPGGPGGPGAIPPPEAIQALVQQVLAEQGGKPGAAPHEVVQPEGEPAPHAAGGPAPHGGPEGAPEEGAPGEPLEKAAVHYRPAEKPSQSCMTCAHFQKASASPHAPVIPSGDGGGKCDIVAGPILPQGTCDRFEPSQEQQAHQQAMKSLIAVTTLTQVLLKGGKPGSRTAALQGPDKKLLITQPGVQTTGEEEPDAQRPKGKDGKPLPATLKSNNLTFGDFGLGKTLDLGGGTPDQAGLGLGSR